LGLANKRFTLICLSQYIDMILSTAMC